MMHLRQDSLLRWTTWNSKKYLLALQFINKDFYEVIFIQRGSKDDSCYTIPLNAENNFIVPDSIRLTKEVKDI